MKDLTPQQFLLVCAIKLYIMKVFIVEDSALVRGHLIEMLSGIKGVQISGIADEPWAAINAIKSLDPDCVILDIKLFGGSGIEVLRNIKKHNGLPLVIVITNYPYPQYREKCIELGADYFFDKSKEFKRVPEIVSEFQQSHPDNS